MSSENEMPDSIKNDFNNFWNIYGKNIEYITKNAKKDLGPGVMVVDIGIIQNKLSKLNNKTDVDTDIDVEVNTDTDTNTNDNSDKGETYYITLDSLPSFITEVDEFKNKIENSKDNNMYYVILIKNNYNTLIGNEDSN
jgi:predicted RNA-binding protein Jag